MVELYPFQEEAAAMVMAHSCIIADECGLGKTYSALAPFFRLGENGGPVLIVCRKSVMLWWEEVIRQFDPLAYVVRAGRSGIFDEEDSETLLTLQQIREGKPSYWIVHYDGLRIQYYRYGRGAFPYMTTDWQGCIVDEAHNIKDRTAKKTKSIFAVRARRRVLLTATPVVNHNGDLWTLLHYVDPKAFKSFYKFYWRYNEIEKRYLSTGNHSYLAPLGPKNEEELALVLSRYMIKRSTKEVNLQLPEKRVQYVPIVMKPGQRLLYQYVAKTIFLELDGGNANDPIFIENALQRITYLRQVISCPEAIDPDVKGGKAEWWYEFILDHPDEPLVTFTWFTTAAELLGQCAKRRKQGFLLAIRGESDEATKGFQNGEVPHFIGTYSTASEGLNLQRASRTILYDPWWVGTTLYQAESRICRLSSNHKSIHVYRLVVRNTIDADIWRAADEKWTNAELLYAMMRRLHLDVT